jgi:hypothetical protein
MKGSSVTPGAVAAGVDVSARAVGLGITAASGAPVGDTAGPGVAVAQAVKRSAAAMTNEILIIEPLLSCLTGSTLLRKV